MLHRLPPPPDFRYVWLHPATTSGAASIAAGTVGLAGFALALWTGHEPVSLGLTLAGSALGALALSRSERRLPVRGGAREVTMAIVPWGIVVSPDTEPRVLRWPAIRRVDVDVAHTLHGGTPSIVSSLVTVQAERETLAGRAAGAVDLEALLANLDGYAAEAARPVAADLEGLTVLGDGVTEPIAAALREGAEALCGTSQGAARLSLPTGGYRTHPLRVAARETVAVLRAALGDSHRCAADPRPLAALVAGLLDARALVPDLLRLTSCPHPVVALFAKAAARRLGAAPNRAGSLEEVGAFVFEEDMEIAALWAEEGALPEVAAG